MENIREISATLRFMNAWVFDVDGVLSNLETRELSERSLIAPLIKILQNGDLFSVNTGRDTVWVTQHIFKPLQDAGITKGLLKDIFLACEKGGTWQEADQPLEIYQPFVLPSPFVAKVKKLVEDEFHDCGIFDKGKKTMISIEMRKDVSIDYFLKRQKELHSALTKYLQEFNLTSTHLIQEDLIATDIIHRTAGKDMGMQHILTWMEATGRHPEHFYCFGDNPSDLHMGDLLKQHDLNFTFVYVGTKPISPPSFLPFIPKEKFDKGTAEALKKFL